MGIQVASCTLLKHHGNQLEKTKENQTLGHGNSHTAANVTLEYLKHTSSDVTNNVKVV